MKQKSGLLLVFICFCAAVIFAQDEDIEKSYRDSLQFFKQEKWEQALEGFRKVKQTDPNYRKVSKYLDKTKEELGRMYYKQGMKLYKQEKIEDSLQNLEKSMEYHPKYKEKAGEKIGSIYYDFAIELRGKGSYEEAINNLNKCMRYDISMKDKCDRKTGEFYHEYGIICYNRADYEKAVKNLKTSLNFEEDKSVRKKISSSIEKCRKRLAKQYFELGKKNMEKGDYLEAGRNFSAVQANDRYYPGINKVIAENRNRMIEKAKEIYVEGLKEYDQGNIKSAIELWEKTLQHDPGNLKAQTSLERTRAELEKKQ